MSLYRATREEPYYGAWDKPWDPEWCKDPHILKWWTPAHDALMPPLIEKYRWHWASFDLIEKIVSITPSDTLEAWRAEDPLCQEYVWYNILRGFAGSRAQETGLLAAMQGPRWNPCLLCGHRFREDALPLPLVHRSGISEADFDQMEYCPPCLINALPECGHKCLSEEEVLAYLRNLADVLQRVPITNFGLNKEYFTDLGREERLAVLRVLTGKPTKQRVEDLFVSWLNALVQASVLEDGTQRMARGTRCLAQDGHLCHSLAEKTMDDFLHGHGIPHEREPRYPEGS